MQITVDMDSHSLTHTLKQESCYIVQHAVRGRVKNEELSGEKYGEAQPEKKKKKNPKKQKPQFNSSDQWLQTFYKMILIFKT